ncbi:hypothetical protein ABES25_09875 [Bacillus gobiensis]|uniref:hypothetical protein n=1 Tax=Bacillus gobiensis TaxID=1441095 RepID=UPI003D1B720C
MKFEELRKLLQFDDNTGFESPLYMPNEIFNDLHKNISKSPHIAFCYSYIYLVTWLYRYAIYGRVTDTLKKEHLKQILCYGAKTQEVDYLIKKNGVLEKMNYLETTGDFPTEYYYYNEYNYEKDIDGRQLKFETLSDWKMYCEENKDEYSYEYVQKGKNYKIKYPVKAFTRYPNDEEMNKEYEEGYEDGTFFDIDNTHCIPFEVFMYCMSNKDIGCTGFYLYAYLKHQNDLHDSGYDVSLENLASETRIPNSTLNRYISLLKSYRMIDFHHNQEAFCIAYSSEQRRANTYIVNDYLLFSDKPISYERIKVVTKSEYLKQVEEKDVQIWGDKAEVGIAELPF